jgi:hypothetical protein
MPGKAGEIVGGIVVAKVVEQQEWIELRRAAKAKRTLQLEACTFDGRLLVNDLPDRSNGHDVEYSFGVAAELVKKALGRILSPMGRAMLLSRSRKLDVRAAEGGRGQAGRTRAAEWPCHDRQPANFGHIRLIAHGGLRF